MNVLNYFKFLKSGAMLIAGCCGSTCAHVAGAARLPEGASFSAPALHLHPLRCARRPPVSEDFSGSLAVWRPKSSILPSLRSWTIQAARWDWRLCRARRGVGARRGDGTETRRRWLKRAVPCPGRALQAGAMRARALPAPVVAQAAPAAHATPKSISIPAGPLRGIRLCGGLGAGQALQIEGPQARHVVLETSPKPLHFYCRALPRFAEGGSAVAH